jgi:hypothetical protein
MKIGINKVNTDKIKWNKDPTSDFDLKIYQFKHLQGSVNYFLVIN